MPAAQMEVRDRILLASVLMRRSGCALPESNEHLIQWRLKQIAWQYNLVGLEELFERLKAGPGTPLEDEVVAALIDTDSWFFRDEVRFQKIQGQVLPALRALREREQRLDFWVPGCGRGHDVYSLILTVRHHFPAIKHWRLQVRGTDVLEDCIKQAMTAAFSDQDIRRGLPLSLVVRHFTRVEDRWVLHPDLRNEAEFERMNVIDETDARRYDLVVVSNLMPALDDLYREHFTRIFERKIKSRGFLLLGEPELRLGIRPTPKLYKDWGQGLYQLMD
jgi:chemotaxis protein methyltransferase CheR